MTLLQSTEARSKDLLNDPMLVRDVNIILKMYAKSDMVFDIFANAPIIFYCLIVGYPVESD